MVKQPTYEELAKQFAEQKDAIEKISKLNEIFSLLGENPRTNIEVIVEHAAKLLQGACCLYNRLDNEKQSLIAWAYHNLPSDFIRKDTPYGHICYEVTMNEKDKPVVIGDIGSTIYHDTDPNVKKYGLKSYLGFPVLLGDDTIGALCIVDIKEREFSETEIHIISTLAKAVSLEEERNQAKKKLRESEERFRSITNTALDSIFCKDINRHYTFVNSSMVQLMGCTETELVGKVPEEVFNKEDATIVNEVDQRTLSGENVSEVRSLTIAGKPYIFHTIQVPLRDSDGNITGISGIVRDITELKQAEENLRKERDKSQHYLNIAGVILVAIDTEQNVMMINKKGCEILGYEEHEIVGKKWFNRFIKAKEAKEIRSVFNQIISGKIEVAEYHENAILTKYREERIIAWHNSLVRDESGRIIGTLSSGEDITERKRAEEALSKTNERLEQKVKERTAELKERNTVLKVLLDQRKNDKERLEKTIILNIKKLISPNLTRLKKSPLNDRQKTELAILEANLDEIISPFESSLSSEYLKLTPTEMQVANFIRHGATSPEIASSLKLSRRTVDTHRHNIRKKIGIRGKGVNLRTYLSSHT
jgi:PAS domain S-box-containing protein